MLIGLSSVTCPLQAYEGEHYTWTYYLALQVGFSERQAYQIASGAYAIDWDPRTGPMGTWGDWASIASGTPTQELQQVWLRFHAFDENLYAELPGEVDKAKDQRQQHLYRLSREQGNPGPLIHFVQDRHAHSGWWNVRGHAFAGHLPDFLADDREAAWHATQDTVRELILFRDEHLRDAPQARPRKPDWARIREVFDHLLSVNKVPPASPPSKDIRERLPHELQATEEGLAATLASFTEPTAGPRFVASVLARYYPGVNVVQMLETAPQLDASLMAVRKAVREDKEAGRLPTFPDQEDLLPPRWEQILFDAEGRVPPGWVDALYGVETPSFEVGQPQAEYLDVSETAVQVNLRLPYRLDGLKAIQYLHPLPVLQLSEVSDFGVGATDRRKLANGQHAFERQIRRSRAELESGRVTWKATVHAYGFEPVTRELRLLPPPRRTAEQDRPGDPLVELRQAVGAAAGTAGELAAACRAAEASVERVASARAELMGRLGELEAAARSLASAEPGADALANADAAFRRGQAAAQEIARLRDEAGRRRDAHCTAGAALAGAGAGAGLEGRARELASTLKASHTELKRLVDGARAAQAESEGWRSKLEQLLVDTRAAGALASAAARSLTAGEQVVERLAAQEGWAIGLRGPIQDTVARAEWSASERGRILEEMEGLYAQLRATLGSAPRCDDRLRSALEAQRVGLSELQARTESLAGSTAALTPVDLAQVEARLADLEASESVSELLVESILNRVAEARACGHSPGQPVGDQTWIAVGGDAGAGESGAGAALVRGALAACDFALAARFLEQVQPASLREPLSAEIEARRQTRATLAAHLAALAAAAESASPAAIREAGSAALGVANCPGDQDALRALLARAQDELRAKVQSNREHMGQAVQDGQRAQAARAARWQQLGSLIRGLARRVESGAAASGASAGAAESCGIIQQHLSACRGMESRDRNGVILHWVIESRSGGSTTWGFVCQPRGAPRPSGSGLYGPYDTPDQALGRVPANCRAIGTPWR